MEFFSFIGSIFGYILWFFYKFLSNYGLAIIFFTIVLKILMFPLSIKQQKSMAINARLNKKQAELRTKYGKDPEKLNAEMQKLYEKEGVSPASGCLTSFVPMFLLLGVFYSVIYPITNTLHIASDKVSAAINYINSLPGMGITAGGLYRYEQIEFFAHFNKLPQDIISKLGFSQAELDNINHLSNGFNFAGLDLLKTPSEFGVLSVYFLVPLLCFLTSVLSSFITMRIQKGGSAGQQQGCMSVMFIAMPLFSAYIAYSVPAAVGFYWICSTVFSFIVTVILNKFYNVDIMTAEQEARRIAMREQQEAGK